MSSVPTPVYFGLAFLMFVVLVVLENSRYKWLLDWSLDAKLLIERKETILGSLLLFLGIVLVGGGIASGYYGLRMIRSLETDAATATPGPKDKKDDQDEMLPEWLIFEFPNAFASGVTQIEKGNYANTKFAEFYVVQPQNIRAEYYVVYIPPKVNAFAVGEYVLNNYQELRDYLAPKRPIKHKFGDKVPTLGERLPFSNQIVIYHEPPLSTKQQEELWQKFNEKGILIEFHGPEYIAEKRAARESRK